MSFSVLQTRLSEARAIARVAPHLLRLRPGSRWNLGRLLEERARQHGELDAVLFEEQRYSWSDVNRAVDRTARAFRELGIERGDVVALVMDNRPEFLFAITALNRLRAAGALINTNITGTALAHAIRIAEPVAILGGQEHREKIEGVLSELDVPLRNQVWIQGEAGSCDAGDFLSFDACLAEQSDEPIPDLSLASADDRLGFIYTSGTTGLPKAAILSNKRVLAPGAGMGRGIFEMEPGDVVYLTTPLYHSVGMYIGWSGTLTTGATLALRRRFSASRFWDDVHRFGATIFVYIGELCRYLLNQPRHPHERDHALRIAGGNGLRPDIWEAFQERFGIPLIREYYGATEGNSVIVNMAGRPGMVGRMIAGARLLNCDLETGEPIRNETGYCDDVSEGETGLLVSPIHAAAPFDGYADGAATKKKILEGVFSSGDQYFNTGDLLTLHEDGWLSFADRVGDTYRWKGENVSTNEVAEILNGAPGVLETNVYGVEVPGADGRAGMASVNCGPDFEIDAFAAFACANLAAYQRPIFLRLQKDMRITVTLKHQKVDYRREGYDPARVSDPLYLLDGEHYQPLDAAVFANLEDGSRKIR